MSAVSAECAIRPQAWDAQLGGSIAAEFACCAHEGDAAALQEAAGVTVLLGTGVSSSQWYLLVEEWRAEGSAFGAALIAYVEELLMSGRSRRECRELTYKLARYRRACLRAGFETPEQLTVQAVREVNRRLMGLDGGSGVVMSAGASRRLLSAARGFLVWASRTGRVPSDVPSTFVALPRVAAAPPDVLTEGEIERVLNQVQGGGDLADRDRAMAELLYSTGIRRAELVGLDVGDVDFERRAITVRHGKGQRSRVVPAGQRALEWLERYLPTVRRMHLRHVSEMALFLSRGGARCSVKTVTARMRARLVAAGISKRGSCHVFRHSAATLMHDAGADIRDLQALLGHALLTSTQLYTRVSVARLHEVHARTHPAEWAYSQLRFTP